MNRMNNDLINFFFKAAFHLAEWCLANSSAIDSKVVVELGSGNGLVGLTIFKKCNPKSVIVTDFHPKVLETLKTNVQMNSATEIQVSSLDWVEFAQQGSSSNKAIGPPDVILASGTHFLIFFFLHISNSGLHHLLTTISKFFFYRCCVWWRFDPCFSCHVIAAFTRRKKRSVRRGGLYSAQRRHPQAV